MYIKKIQIYKGLPNKRADELESNKKEKLLQCINCYINNSNNKYFMDEIVLVELNYQICKSHKTAYCTEDTENV